MEAFIQINRKAISTFIVLSILITTIGVSLHNSLSTVAELARSERGIQLPSGSGPYLSILQIALIESQKYGIWDCYFVGNKVYRGASVINLDNPNSGDDLVWFKCQEDN